MVSRLSDSVYIISPFYSVFTPQSGGQDPVNHDVRVSSDRAREVGVYWDIQREVSPARSLSSRDILSVLHRNGGHHGAHLVNEGNIEVDVNESKGIERKAPVKWLDKYREHPKASLTLLFCSTGEPLKHWMVFSSDSCLGVSRSNYPRLPISTLIIQL